MKRLLLIVTAVAIVAVTAFAVVATADKSAVTAINAEEAVYAATYKQGSTGSVVKTIQQKLKNWGYYTGAVDGIYGAKTKAAVVYFQKKNSLAVDGIAGPKTLAAMGISSASTTSSASSASSYTNSDLNLLARLICGEARGESYTGKVAVGAVVMNRVKSASFPNTISGVIYQPYAFTAVSDGQINLTPDASCKEATKAAMNGYDPTYGAIYYYNPSIATSKWIFSRKTTVTIGNHVFAV
ncbi:MAG: spore cortex-lytic enzyme [Clostridia bacterium]|nr:spore cortex-lytic enzyme [Clostridia bacterium]